MSRPNKKRNNFITNIFQALVPGSKRRTGGQVSELVRSRAQGLFIALIGLDPIFPGLRKPRFLQLILVQG